VVLCQENTATCNRNTAVAPYSDFYLEANIGAEAEFGYGSDMENGFGGVFLPATTYFAIEGAAGGISAGCINCTFDGNTFTIPGNTNNNRIVKFNQNPNTVDVALCSDSGTGGGTCCAPRIATLLPLQTPSRPWRTAVKSNRTDATLNPREIALAEIMSDSLIFVVNFLTTIPRVATKVIATTIYATVICYLERFRSPVEPCEKWPLIPLCRQIA